MTKSIPSDSIIHAQNGSFTMSSEFGAQAIQERANERRGKQYLLINSTIQAQS